MNMMLSKIERFCIAISQKKRNPKQNCKKKEENCKHFKTNPQGISTYIYIYI